MSKCSVTSENHLKLIDRQVVFWLLRNSAFITSAINVFLVNIKCFPVLYFRRRYSQYSEGYQVKIVVHIQKEFPSNW